MFSKFSIFRVRPLTARGAFSVLTTLAVLTVVASLYINLKSPAPDKMNREELTRAKMKSITVCIYEYQSDKKEWPDVKSWDEQLKPYFVRDSVFSAEALAVDGWGNRIKYGTRNEGGHPEAFLCSSGRNGIDENGTNDDILIEIPP